jgi:hypothetical protein
MVRPASDRRCASLGAQRLRLWREAEGNLLLVVAARRLGITPTQLRVIEAGDGLPGLGAALRFQDVAGIDPHDWFAAASRELARKIEALNGGDK